MNLGRLEFRYSMPPENQRVAVRVSSSDYYNKTLTFLQQLCDELKRAIPFEYEVISEPYEVISEPEVNILGGMRINGMASVEMYIKFKISDTKALSLLKSKGFWDKFEKTR